MDNISDLTYAYILSSIGKRTDVIVRFSIVAAFVGSPEWIRDPRGMAVKFYAGSPQGGPKQGCIWDLVGNNFLVRLDMNVSHDVKCALASESVTSLLCKWRMLQVLFSFSHWPQASPCTCTCLLLR